jgi:8-oxo-dGTP diphosphatase
MSVVRCVGAIVFDAAGRLLVIRRGHAPAVGLWSVPGGRVEPGESDALAVARELLEETGLTVVPTAHAGVVLRAAPSGDNYEIHDYDCSVVGDPSMAAAADDAADLRWVGRSELAALQLTEGLWEALSEWDRLPTAGADEPGL